MSETRGKHAKAKQGAKALGIAIGVLAVLLALAAVLAFTHASEIGALVQQLQQGARHIEDTAGSGSASEGASADSSSASDAAASESSASSPGSSSGEASSSSSGIIGTDQIHLPTRQIASYGDVAIHSPIAQEVLTGVLFHQASYTTALVVTTELPEANPEGLSEENPVRVNNDQVGGSWVDADALHLYRITDTTEMDTSIDVGAPWGSTVFAPVTGTVVLVQEYDLYDQVPDVRIHIQPDGHPELDVVLLHQYDPQVKAGDHVTAGLTPLASVRDIAIDLSDVQLGYYTKVGDPGNHSHIQVNNADEEGYRENTLKDAFKVGDSSSSSSQAKGSSSSSAKQESSSVSSSGS